MNSLNKKYEFNYHKSDKIENAFLKKNIKINIILTKKESTFFWDPANFLSRLIRRSELFNNKFYSIKFFFNEK